MKGKLTGMAFRVPVPTVSVVDLTVKTTKDTSYAEISAAFQEGQRGPTSKGIDWTSDEVVSSDFITAMSSPPSLMRVPASN